MWVCRIENVYLSYMVDSKNIIAGNHWLLVVLLFLFWTSAGALQFVFFYPDEMHYTDAALQMVETHDYLTPYKADGTPRFLKPILTYWMVVPGYHLFGIKYFSSRVLFWLAGGFLAAFVYWMTFSISKDRRIALLGALLTASNPLVMMSATRSIPDIVLAFFLTLSAWGFIAILNNPKPENKYYWMAYLGAALAFATKGLPAAAYAGFSFLFLWINPWNRISLRSSIRILPAIVAIFIAFGWFAAMYVLYGSEYLHSFYEDQVGYRVTSAIFLFFKNGFLAMINLFLFLLPWSVIVVVVWRRNKNLRLEQCPGKAITGYVLGYVLFTFLLSSFVFKFYDRYLLPAIPLISILLAHLMVDGHKAVISSAALVILRINVVLAGILVFILITVGCNWQLLSGLLAASLAVLTYLLRWHKRMPEYFVLANLLMMLFLNGNILIGSLIFPEPGEQIARRIESSETSLPDKLFVYDHIHISSKLRISTGNSITVEDVESLQDIPSGSVSPVIFRKEHLHEFSPEKYEIILGSDEWANLDPRRFPGFLQKFVADLKESGEKFYLARPLQANP